MAPPCPTTEKSFTSQQVAEMRLRLSTRRRTTWRRQFPSEIAPEGIALDHGGSKLYIANGASNDVSVVDLKSRKELNRIKVGDGPWGIAVVTAAK